MHTKTVQPLRMSHYIGQPLPKGGMLARPQHSLKETRLHLNLQLNLILLPFSLLHFLLQLRTFPLVLVHARFQFSLLDSFSHLTFFLFLQPFLMPLSPLHFVLQHSVCQPIVLAFLTQLSWRHFVVERILFHPAGPAFLNLFTREPFGSGAPGY